MSVFKGNGKITYTPATAVSETTQKKLELMLIIFNMAERKISDEVSKSCNHIQLNTDGWCLHHIHIRKTKAGKKLTHALSQWMYACECVFVEEEKNGKICHIEIKFSIYGNFVFSQKKNSNFKQNEQMHVFESALSLIVLFVQSVGLFSLLILFFTRFHHYYLWQQKTYSQRMRWLRTKSQKL